MSRQTLALFLALSSACVADVTESTREANHDAEQPPAMRSEPPWTPEDVECVIGSRSNGGDGLERGALYDEWSCDWSGERRYLFTPCSAAEHCGPGQRCDWERGRCIVGQKCRLTDEFQPDKSDPNRWNCELANGRHGICLNTDNCIPICNTDNDCPGVECMAIGAYRLCKII
jgi:hypothetical protein